MQDNAVFELIELDEDNVLKISAWTLTVPEFDIIIRKDRGQRGEKHDHTKDWYKESDSGGRKKLYARRRLTFIQLMYGFRSHLRNKDDAERRAQAMSDTGLTEKDMDEDMMNAIARYRIILSEASRGLRTLGVMERTLDKLDTFLERLDLTAEDKMGRPKYDAGKAQDTIYRMKQTYQAVQQFRETVMTELTAHDSGIRGKAEKGDLEGRRRNPAYSGEMGDMPKNGKAADKALSWKDAGNLVSRLEDRMPGGRPLNQEEEDPEDERDFGDEDRVRRQAETDMSEVQPDEEEEDEQEE